MTRFRLLVLAVLSLSAGLFATQTRTSAPLEIYVVDTEAGLLNVRMPPTVRLAEEDVVAVRYQGTAPPVYDPESGRVTGR